MNDSFRVIIAGSRTFNDYSELKEYCNSVLSNKLRSHEVLIISGGANGADKLGEKYAEELGLKTEVYLADWDSYGKSAGYRRNALMADNADALIAFWNGKSKGTNHMINIANEKGLNVKVYIYE